MTGKIGIHPSVGENVEELFTRIASVAFEKVMKSEVEAASSIRNSAGQLVQNSALISEPWQ